ncbi:hypothetical protein B0H17DRAFT_1151527 [Mycena rosella]|uniref:Uncharacterized protein n=1 Tax=Mycena rosella TaxID=1033263 RepID=A0AAD7FGH8_MYCRO|nr:hypothetical protein B0H17DRAFT_1151527 [Mycena rosella]
MCLFKITNSDGSTTDFLEVPMSTPLASLRAELKPKIEQARQRPTQVSDDEARREANTGFKKVSEEHKGCGGATKYQKKDRSTASKSSKTASDDKSHVLGNVVFIPDAHLADPDASDAADDIKDMGLAAVPSLIKTQQLKDRGLVVTEGPDGGDLVVRESWSAEHINKKFLALSFPQVWAYMKNTHQPLEDGTFHWMLLVAERNTLKEFVKRGPITGNDLVTVMSGKGKRAEQRTLYFDESHALHQQTLIWVGSGVARGSTA